MKWSVLVTTGICVFIVCLVFLIYSSAGAPGSDSFDAGLVILSVALLAASFPVASLISTRLLRPIWSRVTALEQAFEAIKQANAGWQGCSSGQGAACDTVKVVASVAHEIRASLTAIMGMTELVLETDLDDEQRRYVDTIKVSSNAMMKVIGDLLDYAKIGVGKISIQAAPFSLRESLDAMANGLAFMAGSKDLEFISAVAPNVPDTLVGDPDRLGQVVTNLVGNAVKFTKQGQIAFRVEKEAVSEREVTLLFTVADTGIGISEAIQGKIFDAFFQAEEGNKLGSPGAGLGLTISSQLVARMGGRLWVESVRGEGSVFSFTARFDLHSEEEPATAAAAEESGRLAG